MCTVHHCWVSSRTLSVHSPVYTVGLFRGIRLFPVCLSAIALGGMFSPNVMRMSEATGAWWRNTVKSPGDPSITLCMAL